MPEVRYVCLRIKLNAEYFCWKKVLSSNSVSSSSDSSPLADHSSLVPALGHGSASCSSRSRGNVSMGVDRAGVRSMTTRSFNDGAGVEYFLVLAPVLMPSLF